MSLEDPAASAPGAPAPGRPAPGRPAPGAGAARTRSAPPWRALALGALLLIPAAVLAVLAADAAGTGSLVIRNAGPIAQRGAPIAALIADVAGSLTLGAALLAGWILRRGEDRRRALLAASIGSGVWTLAQLVSLLLSYAIATGQPVEDPRFGSDLAVYLGTELGRWLLAATLLAAAVTAVALLSTGRRLARVLAVLAGLALFAKAMTGHASGAADHEAATSTILIHLLGVGVWAGGLAVLQILPLGAEGPARAADETREGRVRDDAEVIRRYSHLALICWVAVAASGLWALWLRMDSLDQLLTSAYVQIGAAKAVLLVVLGLIGAQQRGVLARAASGGLGIYRRLALLELGLMSLAIALAAAMSSSPPPADASPAPGSLAELLTGYPLPPAPVLPDALTAWRPDALLIALAIALLLGWWRPGAPARSRSASARLAAGAVLLVVVGSGPLAVYAKVLASAHLIEHATLFALVGPLLGSAVPAPRWLQCLGARSPWPLWVLSTVPVLLLSGFYAVPLLLRSALQGHVLHLVLLLGAVALGAVQTWIVDALRRTRSGWPVLIGIAIPVLLLAAAGLQLALGETVLIPSWFGATGRPWRTDALADQRAGGWGVLLLALALAGMLTGALGALTRRSSGPVAVAR